MKGERKETNRRRLRLSESDSDDEDTAPLLTHNSGSGNHGTFQEANANHVNSDDNTSSDDENGNGFLF